jgi:hypothetical protein
MTKYALKNNSDKKLSVLRLGKHVSDIVAAQIPVNVKALVEKELNKVFAIEPKQRVFEDSVLDFDLSVVVALKYFGQC